MNRLFHSIVPCTDEVLYRATDKKYLQSHFSLATIAIGIFAFNLEPINFTTLRRHINTNSTNGAYYLSFSKDKDWVTEFANGNYFSIDPAFYREEIIDAQKSYDKNYYNFPNRLLPEKECITRAVFNCSIMHITIDEKTIANPFYIAIHTLSEESRNEFVRIYLRGISLVSGYYGNPDKFKEPMTDFIAGTLNFYRNCYLEQNLKNPFDLTLQEFTANFPEYSAYFIKQAALACIELNEVYIVSDLVRTHALSMFMQSLETSKSLRERKCDESYNDPYARNQYD